MNNQELLICQHTQDEGFGAVYERIMLERLLKKLVEGHKIQSVLEYGSVITKGYDNLAIMDQAQAVIADKDIGLIKSLWKFKKKPCFVDFKNIKAKFDLVWNFALVQQDPDLIEKMIVYSKKYVLVFTPNFLNIGTPAHYLLHWLSKTECQHAERGRIDLRTPLGLKKFFIRQGLRVLKTGMVDLPPWPDTAFSIKDVKKMLGFKVKKNKQWFPKEPKVILEKIEKMTFLEQSSLPSFFKLFFAHHLFVLGEIRK